MKDTTCPNNTHTALVGSDECLHCGYKSKDTTTTIDELDEIIMGLQEYQIGVDVSKDEFYTFFPELRKVRQGLLQWHLDKARSYVLEVIGEDEEVEKYTPHNYTVQLPTVPTGICRAYGNEVRQMQRAKLDQTLKAIGGQDNE